MKRPDRQQLPLARAVMTSRVNRQPDGGYFSVPVATINMVAARDQRDRTSRQFRYGVATGSTVTVTIHHRVDAAVMEMPQRASVVPALANGTVTITAKASADAAGNKRYATHQSNGVNSWLVPSTVFGSPPGRR